MSKETVEAEVLIYKSYLKAFAQVAAGRADQLDFTYAMNIEGHVAVALGVGHAVTNPLKVRSRRAVLIEVASLLGKEVPVPEVPDPAF